MSQSSEKETPRMSRKVFDHANDLPKERALEILSGHLKSWTGLKEEDLDVSVLQGGFINRIFLCHNKVTGEKVLIRLYGGKMLAKQPNVEKEVLMFHLIALQGVGPKLLGIFEGGRIEEYLDCHILSREEACDPAMVRIIARQVARLHSMTVPITKKPVDMLSFARHNFKNNWENYCQRLKESPPLDDARDQVKQMYIKCLSFDWIGIIDWISSTTKTLESRVVFCHNDTNPGNYLVTPSREGDSRILLCDFEYSSYNYRGRDIGGLLKARNLDVKGFWALANGEDVEYKGPTPYPEEKERRQFVEEYLRKWKELNAETVDETSDTVDHVMLEAELYAGINGLVWAGMLISPEDPLEKKLRVQPGLWVGEVAVDLEERKKRFLDMRQRYKI